MIIRETNRKTIDGLPIVQLKIGGEMLSFYRDDEKDELVEYDENINNISYSYEETTDASRKIIREETKKLLKTISRDRVLGFHEYFNSENEDFKAIVIWKKSRGTWRPTLTKGLSGLKDTDIAVLLNGIKEIGW